MQGKTVHEQRCVSTVGIGRGAGDEGHRGVECTQLHCAKCCVTKSIFRQQYQNWGARGVNAGLNGFIQRCVYTVALYKEG